MMSPPPDESTRKSALTAGFTLIELSIVLVIIGLIIGGVLVGKELINAAALRAQISQIEQYNTAANTFYGKYSFLPGDIPASLAVQLGTSPSVASRTISGIAYGNGDGILNGVGGQFAPIGGEDYLFWQDLLTAGLVADQLMSVNGSPCNMGNGFCAVPARIGQGNGIYVYIYGGAAVNHDIGGINYFGLSVPIGYFGGGDTRSNPGLTVTQAYAIDTKVDDGLPESGNIMAFYDNSCGNLNGHACNNSVDMVWVNPAGNPGGNSPQYNGPQTGATQGSSTTCYDNGNSGGAAEHYSMSQNGGAGMNCALSFKIQAGDISR